MAAPCETSHTRHSRRRSQLVDATFFGSISVLQLVERRAVRDATGLARVSLSCHEAHVHSALAQGFTMPVAARRVRGGSAALPVARERHGGQYRDRGHPVIEGRRKGHRLAKVSATEGWKTGESNECLFQRAEPSSLYGGEHGPSRTQHQARGGEKKVEEGRKRECERCRGTALSDYRARPTGPCRCQERRPAARCYLQRERERERERQLAR